MDTTLFVSLIVGGSLVFAGAIVTFVMFAVSRARARMLAQMQAEGIVLDSGPAHVRVAFSGFRGPQVFIGSGSRSGPGRVVLTRSAFRITSLPNLKYGVGVLGREALACCSVAADASGLHVRGDGVPGTSGTFELFVGVADPAQWVAALTQAGARARAA